MTPSLLDTLLAPGFCRADPRPSGTRELAATMSSGMAWPRISIVIPSYNQAQYLEETIRSVLLQHYPNLELYIMDGGSTDDSLSVIRKYERWLTGWISERDGGQSDAINKGFAKCSGEIFNWLCSDDLLAPGALAAVATAFADDPLADVVVGDCYCHYEKDPARSGLRPSSIDRIQARPYAFGVWQPSCFFKRSLMQRVQLLRTDLHYCMDRELWCYFCERGARWVRIERSLSVNRFTGENKSVRGKENIIAEIDGLYRHYTRDRVPLTYWLRRVWLPLLRLQKHDHWFGVSAGARVLSSGVSLLLRMFYPQDRVKVLRAEFYSYEMW